MKYKALLFDLDGTLINSVYDLHESANYILRKYGYKERTIEEINSFIGNGLKNLVKLSLGEEREDFENIVDEFKKYYFARCTEKTFPYEGMKETLIKLKDAGYKLAVVTNKPDTPAKEICDCFFNGIFDFVLGEKSELKRKPDKEMTEFAMSVLGVNKEESLYIGDSEVDIKTAENTGIDVLCVSYGFRTKEQLLSSGGVNIVDNPVDIYEFLVSKCG